MREAPFDVGVEFRAKGSDFGRFGLHVEQRVKTLGVSSRILSKGFRLWALWLALCSKGSDFGRFGLHLEQRVETLAVRPVF